MPTERVKDNQWWYSKSSLRSQVEDKAEIILSIDGRKCLMRHAIIGTDDRITRSFVFVDDEDRAYWNSKRRNHVQIEFVSGLSVPLSGGSSSCIKPDVVATESISPGRQFISPENIITEHILSIKIQKRSGPTVMPKYYLGADLTSAFSKDPRPIDVALLCPTNQELLLQFAQANWPSPAEVLERSPALEKLLTSPFSLTVTQNDLAMALDGPQGLATLQSEMRQCEQQLGAAGKTPDELPSHLSKAPFQNYIRSSLDLFAALVKSGARLAGLTIDAQTWNLFEIYPGAEWRVLAEGATLKGKDTVEGRAQRMALLQKHGIKFPSGLSQSNPPTSDQNDAAIGALLIYWFFNEPDRVALIGVAPKLNAGNIIEGYILHAVNSP